MPARKEIVVLDLPASSVGAVVKLLEPVFKHAVRVYQERQAAQGFTPNADLVEKQFEDTFARLIKGHEEAGWWQQILAAIEQYIVATDWLAHRHIQQWLSLSAVQQDLKAEAKARLLRVFDTKASKRKERLAKEHSKITGEREGYGNRRYTGIRTS